MERARWKRIWPALAWAGILFILSSIPGDELPYLQTPIGFDKLLHMIAYAILGILAVRAWTPDRISPWIIFAFCVGYGVTDELHQILVPGRFPDVFDWIADAIGAGIGILVVIYWRRRRPRKA